MALLTNKVPHQDIASLSDTDTKQKYKHYHVEAVGAGSQCLIADLINEIGNHYL